MKVSELIKKLEKLNPDKSIMCQVLGSEKGAWNMNGPEVHDIPTAGFIVIQMSHPDIKDLTSYKGDGK